MKVIILFVLLLFMTGCSNLVKNDNEIKVDTKVFGIGYSENLAIHDSYLNYHAINKGIHFNYYGGSAQFKMESPDNRLAIPAIEELTNAQLKAMSNSFFIYEYHHCGMLKLPEGKNVSASIEVGSPSGFLSRLLLKGLLREYERSDKRIKGTLYVTHLDYEIQSGNQLRVNSEMRLLAEPEGAVNE